MYSYILFRFGAVSDFPLRNSDFYRLGTSYLACKKPLTIFSILFLIFRKRYPSMRAKRTWRKRRIYEQRSNEKRAQIKRKLQILEAFFCDVCRNNNWFDQIFPYLFFPIFFVLLCTRILTNYKLMYLAPSCLHFMKLHFLIRSFLFLHWLVFDFFSFEAESCNWLCAHPINLIFNKNFQKSLRNARN